jgi:TniQ
LYYHVELIPGDDAIILEGVRVHLDALVKARTPICPCCIAESGYARVDWDLAPVTVCTRHHLVLRDECSLCGQAILWDRPALLLCESCGADLGAQNGSSASQAEVEVSADFAALAPFRVRVHRPGTMVATWDEMFHVAKALLLPDARWANSGWEKFEVSRLSVAQRHFATHALAAIRDNNTYELGRLDRSGLKALQPLSVIPRARITEKAAVRVLMDTGGLSTDVAEAIGALDILHPAPNDEIAIPLVTTRSELVSFLTIDQNALTGLEAHDVIRTPGPSSIGYEIEQLIRARSFLNEGLLTLEELRTIVGVALEPSDLADAGLLPRWNPRDKSDCRVRLDLVVAIHGQLISRWHQRGAHQTGIRLGSVADCSLRPFQAVSAGVAIIIGGSLALFGWTKPWAWADVCISAEGRLSLESVISVRRP